MAQKRHTEIKLYWQRKVNEFNNSGLTQREFCRQNDLSYWSFNSWNRRLSKDKGATSLVEIPSKTIKSMSQPKDEFEIITKNGLRIKIPDKFKPETLSSILEVLGDGR